MSAAGKQVWSSNVEIEKQIEQSNKSLDTEFKNTSQLLKDHDDIIRKYKETIDAFHKKLSDSEQARTTLAEQRVEVTKNTLTALNQRDVLNLEK